MTKVKIQKSSKFAFVLKFLVKQKRPSGRNLVDLKLFPAAASANESTLSLSGETARAIDPGCST